MDRHARAEPSRLIDAHVHIQSPEGLAQLAAAGMAAVRDAGLRQNAEPGGKLPESRSGLLVVSACWALYKKGGYGSRFGVPVETRAEIRDEIARLKAAGAGIIKAMASGIVSLREPGRITAGGFTEDELSCIVEEAAAAGLGVMAHVNGEGAIASAARAGVRSIEHGFFMTRRSLDELAEASVFWVPTVGALARAAHAGAAAGEAHAFIDRLIRSHLEMIGLAHELGVALAIGTDSTLPDPFYGQAYAAELAYFERAGLSRDETHTIAREDGARLLGI
jgi:imidazolonepropionase-like amidohydrolase